MQLKQGDIVQRKKSAMDVGYWSRIVGRNKTDKFRVRRIDGNTVWLDHLNGTPFKTYGWTASCFEPAVNVRFKETTQPQFTFGNLVRIKGFDSKQRFRVRRVRGDVVYLRTLDGQPGDCWWDANVLEHAPFEVGERIRRLASSMDRPEWQATGVGQAPVRVHEVCGYFDDRRRLGERIYVQHMDGAISGPWRAANFGEARNDVYLFPIGSKVVRRTECSLGDWEQVMGPWGAICEPLTVEGYEQDGSMLVLSHPGYGTFARRWATVNFLQSQAPTTNAIVNSWKAAFSEMGQAPPSDLEQSWHDFDKSDREKLLQAALDARTDQCTYMEQVIAQLTKERDELKVTAAVLSAECLSLSEETDG